MARRYKAATMKDVAERAHVSVATVSRVINSDSSVSEANRNAVTAAIADVGYELKPSAPGKTELRVGLVIPDVTNPYFGVLMQGITNVARVHHVELVLCNADWKAESEHYHLESLLERGVDGIIHIPFHETVDPIVSDLIDDRFPVVFLDREYPIQKSCSVTSNNEEGAYQAVTYLLNLGHREIVFVSGSRHLSTSILRREGFERGLAEFGVSHRPELLLYGDTTQESAYREMLDLLEREGDRPSFTAVFASNDQMAYGAWQALETKGWRVPEDISIIGYDDIPFSSFISLTTIAQPANEIGRNALILLMDLINGRCTPPQRIVLRDSLIIRRSCRRI